MPSVANSVLSGLFPSSNVSERLDSRLTDDDVVVLTSNPEEAEMGGKQTEAVEAIEEIGNPSFDTVVGQPIRDAAEVVTNALKKPFSEVLDDQYESRAEEAGMGRPGFMQAIAFGARNEYNEFMQEMASVPREWIMAVSILFVLLVALPIIAMMFVNAYKARGAGFRAAGGEFLSTPVKPWRA